MPLGAYIHIPFCDGKCPYCDFYSLKAGDRLKDRYTSALLSEIEKYSGETCDTIYIGGGTPLQLGEERLAKVLEKAVKTFGTPKEFTVEVNPAPNISKSFEALARCGVNRISMGMQSAVPEELSALGRRHSPDDVLRAVDGAHKCGIENISLDIMVGIPLQTAESLEYSADFAAKAGAAHISAYMLKIEPGTPFFDKKETLGAADDELSSELYLNLCESMAQKGYNQYEISNFAKNGFESKHNLKYWRCGEYLGLGCAAHSFYRGERYYHPRNIEDYIKNQTVIPDGKGGGTEEYVMLGLRLSKGIDTAKIAPISDDFLRTVGDLCKAGLANFDGRFLSLTRRGFLVSNSIISALLERIR